MLSKTELRKKCIEKRKTLGQDYIKNQSDIITRKILNSEEYKKANSIFTYIATCGEVNTSALIKQALCEDKTIIVPVLINKTEMDAGIVYRDTVFIKNRYNIDEPKTKNFYTGKIDIIITPGLSFDKRGSRLGYGGGYFDRFFEKHKEALKIGLCLDEFIASSLPNESHDIKMDIIITQSMEINFR